MERFKVAIIIPAYNEVQSIAEVVNKVLPYGVVIVVDDGSTDKTSIIAQETGIENSEFIRSEHYLIWTASDKTAKENKDKDIKNVTEGAKGRGRGKGV